MHHLPYRRPTGFQHDLAQISEVVDYCGVTEATVEDWMANAGFPLPIKIRRRRFWIVAEVLAFLEAHRVQRPQPRNGGMTS